MAADEEVLDLDAMTGIEGGGPRALVLDLLSLNGDAEIVEGLDIASGQPTYRTNGGYYRLLKMTKAKKGEKPEEVKLGPEVDIVFLKVRRSLQERNAKEMVRWTSEHDGPDDLVELHHAEGKKVEYGTGRELREKYTGLRTAQYVYCLLVSKLAEPLLCRARFKGAALGSDNRDKSMPNFYEYIFKDRKDEVTGVKRHLRHFATTLSTIKEKGENKTYYTVVFKEGADLPIEWQKLADDKLVEVHKLLVEGDKARLDRIMKAKRGFIEQAANTNIVEPIAPGEFVLSDAEAEAQFQQA